LEGFAIGTRIPHALRNPLEPLEAGPKAKRGVTNKLPARPNLHGPGSPPRWGRFFTSKPHYCRAWELNTRPAQEQSCGAIITRFQLPEMVKPRPASSSRRGCRIGMAFAPSCRSRVMLMTYPFTYSVAWANVTCWRPWLLHGSICSKPTGTSTGGVSICRRSRSLIWAETATGFCSH
jgi:hypothetical protein